jgi:hypothetical protein
MFVDRENEIRRLAEAIGSRRNLVIYGPPGIGKTALVAEVIRHQPESLSAGCLYIGGVRDMQDLLHQVVRSLFRAKDPTLLSQLHAQAVTVLTFEAWLKRRCTSQLKGTLYRAAEEGNYRLFLDHFSPATPALAKVIKELFWMRNTPVYLLARDDVEQRLSRFYRFFYWGEGERLRLQALPEPAAAALLESCIERFGLSRLELGDFREEALELGKRVPGAIVKMCSLAADPHYQYGSRIKMKSVYIDYLMSGQGFSVKAAL